MASLSEAASALASLSMPESPRASSSGSNSSNSPPITSPFRLSTGKYMQLGKETDVCLDVFSREIEAINAAKKAHAELNMKLGLQKNSVIDKKKEALSQLDAALGSIKFGCRILEGQKEELVKSLHAISLELSEIVNACEGTIKNLSPGIKDAQTQGFEKLAQKLCALKSQQLEQEELLEGLVKKLELENENGRQLQEQREALKKEIDQLVALRESEKNKVLAQNADYMLKVQSLENGKRVLSDISSGVLKVEMMKRQLHRLCDLSPLGPNAPEHDEKERSEKEDGELVRIHCDSLPEAPDAALFKDSPLHLKIMQTGLKVQAFKKYLEDWNTSNPATFNAALNQSVAGYTPIQLLILMESVEMVRTFLTYTPNLDCVYQGWNLLQFVAFSKKMNDEGVGKVISHLIYKGKFLLEAQFYEKTPPLHLAAYNNNNVTLNALLAVNTRKDVNEKDKQGYGAIHYAAMGNRETLNVLLFQPKIIVNLQDERGLTALHIACDFGLYHEKNPNIIEDLLSSNADPDLKDKHNWTALDYVDQPSKQSIDSFKIGPCHPQRKALRSFLRDKLGAQAQFMGRLGKGEEE